MCAKIRSTIHGKAPGRALAAAIRARAGELAAHWQELAPRSGPWVERPFNAEALTLLADWLDTGDTRLVHAALAANPWGDGSRPFAGAPALVMPLRRALQDMTEQMPAAAGPAVDRLIEATLAAIADAAVKQEEDLRQQAETDPLTGVMSRRAVLRELELRAERAQRLDRPLSIIYMDVDRLKQINEETGHAAGDAALTQLAQMVISRTRTTDRLGRLGGDEFLLVLPDTDAQGARVVAQRLLHVEVDAPAGPTPAGVSIGLASAPPLPPDPAALLSAADAALLKAKKAGRARSGQAS
jgi:diguanylate cyclase (GGDEF)-like protein